jgi:hypothetical protein
LRAYIFSLTNFWRRKEYMHFCLITGTFIASVAGHQLRRAPHLVILSNNNSHNPTMALLPKPQAGHSR